MKPSTRHLSITAKLATLILALASAPTAYAASKRGDTFEFTHHRASISGMLTSSDSWQLEFGYHYMFNKYIGIGGAIGGWKVWYEDGCAYGSDWQIESDDNKPWNIFLRPSIALKTPAIQAGQVSLGLFAEPGIMLNVPYTKVWIRQDTNWPEYESNGVSTTKGQWCAIDARVGIYANIGPCGISAGYTLSNLDVYSRYRHLSYNGTSFRAFYPRKPFMQGAHLTLSYYF